MRNTILVIFVLQLLNITLGTLRNILMAKGKRWVAAVFGLVEILVYTLGVKIVLDNMDEPINLIVYCVSSGIGVFAGMKVEELLPMGFVSIQVYTKKYDCSFGEQLRRNGYGVMEAVADGRDGKSITLTIFTQKKYRKKLYDEIKAFDAHAMIISYDPKYLHGGLENGANAGHLTMEAD